MPTRGDTNMPLSDTTCRNAKGKDKPQKLTDGQGLFLLVQPNGSRLWRMAYRFDGKQKTLAFGVYPHVSLEDARAKRAEARRILATGKDPSQHQREVERDRKIASGHTFESVARAWHSNVSTEWVPAHKERVLSRLERDVFPAIGERPIAEIEAPEILDVLRAVERRGALDISKRLRQSIGSVFRFAIAEGRAKRNPAADLVEALKPKPKVQHFASLKAADVGEFLRRLADYDGEDQTRLSILFTLHTFVRTKEVRLAEWREFDDLDGTEPLWRIPKERMKMGREHIVPLTRASVSILRELRKLAGSSRYVLPSATKSGVISENTMIFGLYRLGYHSRLTVHGFRGTASTILNEQGFNADWIERQLAHVEENKIRGAYNAAEWLEGRREMMAWWSSFLERQAKGIRAVA
jgi:integrase